MNGDIGAFIPIVALSIPLAAVIGKQIVQPLIHSRALQAGGDDGRVKMLEQRVATREQSLETMERSVAQIAEVADFHRQLAAPAADKAPGV
jgi:hypothetical protein